MDQALLKFELRRDMARIRATTLKLLECVPNSFLKVRVHDFYSPVGWHFGHIGFTEELWVCTNALGEPPLDSELSFLFANTPENPKDNRVHLPSRSEIAAYLDETRKRTLDALERTDLDSAQPLVSAGYGWQFALQHECQHQETIAELLQLVQKKLWRTECAEETAKLRADAGTSEMVAIAGGVFTMGRDDPNAYDNEKPEHEVELHDFELDRYPVTAGQWHQFALDGGYRREELWCEDGWTWRTNEAVITPEYWLAGHRAGVYQYCGPFGPRTLSEHEPVSSISWYEADAYARWLGKRLPTEAEWEYAACSNSNTEETRLYPWGRAAPTAERARCELNELATAVNARDVACNRDVGDMTAGASAFGVEEMAGSVWEWTSTPFLPYPGFEAFPYDGYSKDHMDGRHFVCRGGSWATDRRILRCSFRNWYVPTYRQGLLGMRCAR